MTGKNDPRVTLALLGFGLTAGSAFMFQHLLVEEVTPLQLAAGRVALGAVPLVLMMRLARSQPRLSARFLAGVTLLALVDTIGPYLLIAWSQLHVDSSTAALLVSTTPLWTMLIVRRASGEERMSQAAVIGLVAAFAGVAFVVGPDAVRLNSASALGVLAVLVAAVCYAVATVYSKTLMRLADPIGLSAIKLTIASVLLVPTATAVDGAAAYASLSAQGWLALLAVGAVSTGLGRCLYQWIIASAGSVRASLVTYIVPLVALVLGWAVLDEAVGLPTLFGAGLIVCGVALVMRADRVSRLVRSLSWGRRRRATVYNAEA